MFLGFLLCFKLPITNDLFSRKAKYVRFTVSNVYIQKYEKSSLNIIFWSKACLVYQSYAISSSISAFSLKLPLIFKPFQFRANRESKEHNNKINTTSNIINIVLPFPLNFSTNVGILNGILLRLLNDPYTYKSGIQLFLFLFHYFIHIFLDLFIC